MIGILLFIAIIAGGVSFGIKASIFTQLVLSAIIGVWIVIQERKASGWDGMFIIMFGVVLALSVLAGNIVYYCMYYSGNTSISSVVSWLFTP